MTTREIDRLIRLLQKERRVTGIVSSHDVSFNSGIAAAVRVLRQERKELTTKSAKREKG